MRPHPESATGGKALIVAGNLVIVAALIAQYFRPQPYGMFVTILVAGGVVAYSGFWALDPKRTKDATQNLADVATKAGNVVVNVKGRRRDDPQTIVEHEPAQGGHPETTTVTVQPPGPIDPATPTTTVVVPGTPTAEPPASPPPPAPVGIHIDGEGD